MRLGYAGVIGVVAVFFLSCSLVEMSGTMTRKTGEVMEAYSKKNDGFIGKMAGFGGRINTSVGSAIENIAKEESDKPKTEQFVDANVKVVNAATGAVSDIPDSETIAEAQKRLTEIGFDPGPADGIIGKKTRVAIAKYQKLNALEVTEGLDKDTLDSLGIKIN